MSAECYTCESDLSYDGRCVVCELRADITRLREAVRQHKLSMEDRFRVTSGDPSREDKRLWHEVLVEE